MGKDGGFLTPKAIANRIKAKGLQKLRWYCQMCAKQCRDENGFKCHCMSESHARQMSIFTSNPDAFMNEYSKDFEKGFLQIARIKGKRIKANTIYQTYISDREHVHMNSTIWSTLGTFVQYLGKTAKCRVDKQGKDWYIEYIDRDPKVVARQEATARKERLQLTDEEREQRMIEKQIENARRYAKKKDPDEDIVQSDFDLSNRSEEDRIGFSLGGGGNPLKSEEKNAGAVKDERSGDHDIDDGSGRERRKPLSSSSSSNDGFKKPLPKKAAIFSMDLSDDSSTSSRELKGKLGTESVVKVIMCEELNPKVYAKKRELEREEEKGKRKRKSGTETAMEAIMREEEERKMYAKKRKLEREEEKRNRRVSNIGKRKRKSGTETAMEAIMREEEERKMFAKKRKLEREEEKRLYAASSAAPAGAVKSEKEKVFEHWIAPGLVVKLVNKKFMNGRFHKKKGTVVKVIDRFVAELCMSKTREVIRVDQSYLETVLPSLGRTVQIVNGRHRGRQGSLESVDQDKFCGDVKLFPRDRRRDEKRRKDDAKVAYDISFDHICKVDTEFSADIKSE